MTLTRRNTLRLGALMLAAPMLPRPASAATALSMTAMAEGLEEPWALGFLPDGRFLVTERGGRLKIFGDGNVTLISGLPKVHDDGQGGLLDVMVPRDFARSGKLWFSYAHPAKGGASTALGHAVLDGTQLRDFTRVHEGPAVEGGRHFGARVVGAPDGSVFLTTGDRGQGELAQDPARPEGKVLHFTPAGQPMPSAVPGGMPGLWTVGHRNLQGATLDGRGRLWTVEHGARGGDEVNRPQAGRNYGWPVITYGVDYSGDKIGEGQARDGLEQPLYYWDPSIAPSGLAILKGNAFPGWRGHILTGSLNSDLIVRLDPAAAFAETRIETPQTARVRDIREAPDGSLWFLSVGNGAAFRMAPAS